MVNELKMAVLLTCHNRKQKTLNCLKSFYQSISKTSFNPMFEIYLVDDGSTDGTTEAVRLHFPKVNVIQGSGDLYWGGGMRLAWNAALQANPDYYLLLNDDALLYERSLDALLRAAQSLKQKCSIPCILIGTLIDENTQQISYGGRKLYSTNSPRGYFVNDDNELSECDLGNANLMLIAKKVVQEIGILSSEFTHGIADYDYTLRAKKAGFGVWVVPGILGVCNHDHGKGWMSAEHPLKDRINYLYRPTGLAYKEYLFYIKRHFPTHLPAAFLKLWLKTLFPFIYDGFKKK